MLEKCGWFVDFLNRSFAAGVIVLAIVILRFLLKKAPRRLFPPLWGLAALRLVLPWGISSRFSVFNLFTGLTGKNQVGYFRYHGEGVKPVVMFLRPAVAGSIAGGSLRTENAIVYLPPVVQLWGIIAALILLYALVSYLLVRKSVAAAVEVGEKLYLCDDIREPFILGIFRPRIYLPSGMEEGTKACVIAHERAHLRRGDHIWKPLAFVLAAVNWFHPLLWLGYILFCRDIESACDEAVVAAMDERGRAQYSEALLSCAAGRRTVTVSPLAFGEIGVRERVKNVLHYKKPAFWVIAAAVILCIAVAVCFLTDPAKKPSIESANESSYTELLERASVSDGAASEAVADELACAYEEDPSGLLLAMEHCAPEWQTTAAQLLVYGKSYGDLDAFAQDVQGYTQHSGGAVAAILQAIGDYNRANGAAESANGAVFSEDYYEQWIAAGCVPNYMQNDTILIVDGEGNCTIEHGGALTADDVEGREDLRSMMSEIMYPTARSRWAMEPNTKVEYDLHGMLNNIYYEVPDAPGTYQLSKPGY